MMTQPSTKSVRPAGLSKQEQIARGNRWAAIRWGSLVVGMLALQLALGAAAITLATNDESVAVVPDYYERSLKWDESRATRVASEKLDWTVTIEAVDQSLPVASLKITLVNNAGQPVAIQSGTLTLYHHARARNLNHIRIAPTDSGMINVDQCFVRSGLWEVELDVTDHGGQRFARTTTLDVTVTPGNPT
ncbi:MAG: FixH family protein [Planctomycetota bacterium]